MFQINDKDDGIEIILDSGLRISLPNGKPHEPGLQPIIKNTIRALDSIADEIDGYASNFEESHRDKSRGIREDLLGFSGRIRQVADSIRYVV